MHVRDEDRRGHPCFKICPQRRQLDKFHRWGFTASFGWRLYFQVLGCVSSLHLLTNSNAIRFSFSTAQPINGSMSRKLTFHTTKDRTASGPTKLISMTRRGYKSYRLN